MNRDISSSSQDTKADLLADHFAPHPDFSQAQHRVVDADPETTYAAARALDFTDVHGGLVGAAMWARELPERWKNRGHILPRRPTRLTFDDLVAGSEWVILGERPGEIATGVVGTLWKPVIDWHPIDPGTFADFDEPGYGKIVMSVSVRPYGVRRSLLSHDIRVTCTDETSRRKFRLYWTVTAPFIKKTQATTLRTIARQAKRKAA